LAKHWAALVTTGLSVAAANAAQVNVGVKYRCPGAAPDCLTGSATGRRRAQQPRLLRQLQPLRVRRGYYTFHDGAWFYANRHSGPWTFMPTERVPRPVNGVPVTYYKVPPGHAKKMGNPPGAPVSSARGCPPGLAKQGRC